MVRVLKRGGTLFITHLKSVEELNQFHRQLGGPVAHDCLPHPARIEELLKDAGLYKISIINQPGKFWLKGVRFNASLH